MPGALHQGGTHAGHHPLQEGRPGDEQCGGIDLGALEDLAALARVLAALGRCGLGALSGTSHYIPLSRSAVGLPRSPSARDMITAATGRVMLNTMNPTAILAGMPTTK